MSTVFRKEGVMGGCKPGEVFDPVIGRCTPLRDFGISLYMGGKCDGKERILKKLKPADLVQLASLLDGNIEIAKQPAKGRDTTRKPTG